MTQVYVGTDSSDSGYVPVYEDTNYWPRPKKPDGPEEWEFCWNCGELGKHDCIVYARMSCEMCDVEWNRYDAPNTSTYSWNYSIYHCEPVDFTCADAPSSPA